MDLVKEIAAGAAAGMVEYSSCQPIDIVATRCMLREGTERTSMLREVRAIWGAGGLLGMYRGLGPQILAAVPATIGMYVGERQVAKLLRNEDGGLSESAVMVSGLCSGISETTLVCPFEVCKVRLMSASYSSRYRNTFHCFRTILKEEGPWTLYTGYRPMCIRNCIFNSTFFYGVHRLQKDMLPPPKSSSEKLANDVIAGMVMGFIASIPKMPFFRREDADAERPCKIPVRDGDTPAGG
eukprot:TRINITY_DN10178_c0_g1_i2.p1 TRINITY_DN10178_c0_g1~~TRINITY_DN10178_c0_g1_i2.p1  ORF type:complete len:239 (+),score=36.00 TRINITY_DN10178_c0_g1_i2:301-1017(+)